jgi:hemerythrin superfamily protein
VPKLEDDILESLEEHHVLKWTLEEIAAIGVDDERYDPKVTVMMEQVRHHVEEEETDWFPKVRAALPRARLQELGAQLEKAKKTAPRTPNPDRVVAR